MNTLNEKVQEEIWRLLLTNFAKLIVGYRAPLILCDLILATQQMWEKGLTDAALLCVMMLVAKKVDEAETAN